MCGGGGGGGATHSHTVPVALELREGEVLRLKFSWEFLGLTLFGQFGGRVFSKTAENR